jgi:hypothetical protein
MALEVAQEGGCLGKVLVARCHHLQQRDHLGEGDGEAARQPAAAAEALGLVVVRLGLLGRQAWG